MEVDRAVGADRGRGQYLAGGLELPVERAGGGVDRVEVPVRAADIDGPVGAERRRRVVKGARRAVTPARRAVRVYRVYT